MTSQTITTFAPYSNNTTKLVVITEHALVQRMRRRLARDGETFHVTRPQHRSNLGCFYSTADNVVQNWWLNRESLTETARDLGVLRQYEIVEGVEAGTLRPHA